MLKVKSNFVYYIPFLMMWGLVILPKSFQLVLLLGITALLFLTKRIKFNKISISLIIIGCIHILSSLLSFFFYTHLPERLFAAFNLAIVWIIAGLLYSLYSSKLNLNRRIISNICIANILVMFVLIIVYFLFSKMNIYDITIFSNELISDDYINGDKAYRFVGFTEYSNLVPSFILLNLIGVLMDKSRGKIAAILAILAIIPVYFCRSRSALLAYLIIIAAFVITRKNGLSRGLNIMLISMLIIVGVLFFVFSGLYLEIYDTIMSIVNMREGSNNTRMSIYLNSIEMALYRNPFIGVGIKDYVNGFPLGSHCTYIGVFFKTGLIGLGLFMFIILLLTEKILKSKESRFVKFIFLYFAVFFIFEDLDGANWLITMFFTFTAYYLNSNKEVNTCEQYEGYDNNTQGC